MVAKRALNFGTPNAKRQRNETTMVVYRGVKPEMKYYDVVLSYTASTALTLTLNDVGQGTGVQNRVGGKIKIWRIEYSLTESTSSATVLVDLLINNTTGGTVGHTYPFMPDRRTVSSLKRTFHQSGTQNGPKGMLVSHKLPLGVVSKYAGASGTSINSNQIVARILTPAAEDISGNFRIWFTDA